MYSFAPILVCDDILSALDGETAAAVFRDIFSPAGILKRQGRTAVVATHAGKYPNIPPSPTTMLTLSSPMAHVS